MAMREGPDGPSEPLPERRYQPLGKWEPEPSHILPAVAWRRSAGWRGIVWALAGRRYYVRGTALPWRG